jgi:hypothetical protein
MAESNTNMLPERKFKNVPINDVKVVFRTKRELYQFLEHEGYESYISNLHIFTLHDHLGHYYLPPIDDVNLFFLREVIAGRKSVNTTSQVMLNH